MLRRVMMAGGGGPSAGDPHWANVVSLLHFDGVSEPTTFVDEKGKSWSGIGGVQITSAQSKFGGGSAAFDGVDDELFCGSTGDFGFGVGDFTIEAFVRRENSNCVIFDNRNPSGDSSAVVTFIDATGRLCYFDSSTKTGTTAAVVSPGAWTHVAWSRQSGTMRMFADGVMVFQGSAGNDMGTSRPMRIGRDIVGGADFSGHIDEARITKGVARYISSFTPPASPFPNGP